MATESDLRDLLRGPDPEGRTTIDLDVVLTRVRRRRRPKVVAAQALGSVAAVGVLVTAIVTVVPPQQAAMMVAEDSAGGGEYATAPGDADESPLRSSSALSLQSCGEPVVDFAVFDAPSLAVTPVETAAGVDPVPVTVTLTNTQLPARGVSSTPVLTITRDGIVVAQPVAIEAVGFDLDLPANGSFVFDTAVLPVQCDPDSPGDALDALPPGDYEIRAAVDFLGADGEAGSTVVVGPPSAFVIR